MNSTVAPERRTRTSITTGALRSGDSANGLLQERRFRTIRKMETDLWKVRRSKTLAAA